MNKISLNTPIKKLISTYPEIQTIMVKLGFSDITNPFMLNTVGSFMTLKKGAAMRKIDLEVIKQTFGDHNFILSDDNE